MRKVITTAYRIIGVLILVTSLSTDSSSQFTKLAEFESRDFFQSYFFDQDGEAFYYDGVRDAGTTNIFNFSGQQVLSISLQSLESTPITVGEVVPLNRSESLNGGQDYFLTYTYSTNRIGSCVYRGSTGVIEPLERFTRLEQTDVGTKYIIDTENVGGATSTNLLSLPSLTPVSQLPGFVRLWEVSGGRAFLTFVDDVCIRYNDDLSIRYVIDFSQQDYLSVKPLPTRTLSDSEERFVVAKADTVNGELHTRIQIIDSVYQVYFDTSYAGGFAEIQLRNFPGDDLFQIDVLGGGGGLEVNLRASTLEHIDIPNLSGAIVYLPSGRYLASSDSGTDNIIFYDPITFDSVWSVPSEVSYEGSEYSYSGGLAFGPQESYNETWFQYFNNNNRLLTDRFGNPIDTIAYNAAGFSPTFYPVQHEGEFYLFTRDQGAMTNQWNYTFYNYDSRVVNTLSPKVSFSLQLFPNPAATSFSLQSETFDGGALTVVLIDPLGRVVREYSNVHAGEQLALSNVDGLYTVSIVGNGKILASLPLLVRTQ